MAMCGRCSLFGYEHTVCNLLNIHTVRNVLSGTSKETFICNEVIMLHTLQHLQRTPPVSQLVPSLDKCCDNDTTLCRCI